MTEEIRTFHWVDYLVFALSLALSAGIGFYYAVKPWCLRRCGKGDASQTGASAKVQLLGGQNMKPLPVAMSMLASFLSAPFLLGTPVEIYMYGTMYAAAMLAYLIAAPITAHLFVPVFHRQQLTSSYEYLEQRFNGWIRFLGSLLFTLMMILFMSVVVYAPAVALAQVTGLDKIISIFGVGLICTFYTAFGGMKAVIWTDVLQMLIILGGLIAVIIEGTIDVGGPGLVWKRVIEGDRIDPGTWSPDPTIRHTWLTQIIGATFTTLTITGTNQAIIQRYLSIKTTRDAQKAVYIAIFFQELYLALIIVVGFVMFAFYYRCDPVSTGKVLSKDQLVPVFIMDSLGNWIGLPGLFCASVFSASLSTVSSGVNALAAVILVDMIQPLYKRHRVKDMSDSTAGHVSKALAIIFGLMTVGLAFIAPFLGSTLLQVASTVFGMVGGPLLGLFILAMFFPCANAWGAGIGTMVSLAVTGWISIGAILNPTAPTPLPLYTDQCNVTADRFDYSVAGETTTNLGEEENGFLDVYKLSYAWYALFSVLITVVIGLGISFATCGHKDTDHDAKLFFPYYRKCQPCFKLCNCIRCCPVDEEEQKENTKDYGVELTQKRVSLETVDGVYSEDLRQKRSSIDVQFGPLGRISSFRDTTLPPYPFVVSRAADNTGLWEITEEGQEEDFEVHGTSNPAFLEDECLGGKYSPTDTNRADNREMSTTL